MENRPESGSSVWSWVLNNQQLADCCALWRLEPRVGLDTEFIRETTFHPLPGLIQLATAKGIWLIDPLCIDDWTPLVALLRDEAVEKVLHACGEDLELLEQLTGVIPVNLFDTQLAAAYAGYGFSVGFQRLLAQALGIELEKQETRSDWRARPLTERQCQYAADDAWYLLKLREVLQQQLEATRKLAWLLEDCRELVERAEQGVAPEDAWRQVKLAWKLRPQQLAVLQCLCDWREREAKAQDRPRNRILPAAALWELAAFQPRTLAELGRNRALKPNWIRQRGQVVLDLIKTGQALPESAWPARLAQPLPPDTKPWMRQCKDYLAAFAAEQGIAVEILLRKPLLHALMRTRLEEGQFRCPEQIQGWRRQQLLPGLLVRLNSSSATDE